MGFDFMGFITSIDIQATLAVIFLIGMLIFVYTKRKSKEFEMQKIAFPLLYFVLYKTKLGLKGMEKIARKWPRTVVFVSTVGIYAGFIGMLLISYELASGLFTALFKPSSAAPVALVLPFETGLKGTISVPFLYWIISIFIIAVAHEFSHGIVARRYDIKLKSSGFAFLSILVPLIPAAFVEPDEKQMAKKKVKQQLAVMAAGPFANIILAVLFFSLFSFAMAPATEKIVVFDGVKIADFATAQNTSIIYPAESSGMQKGEVVKSIDGKEVVYITNFTKALETKIPGDTVVISTYNQSYNITLIANPSNASKGYMGVSVEQSYIAKESIQTNYPWLLPTILWVSGLFYWLFLLNLGIGLFNLLPMGPVDGGRMSYILFTSKFGEEKGKKIASLISWGFFLLLIILFIIAFVK